MKQEISNIEVMNFEDMLFTGFTSMNLSDFLCKESGISERWEYCCAGITFTVTFLVLYWVCNPFIVSDFDLQFFVKGLSNVDAVVINPVVVGIVKILLGLVFIFFEFLIVFIMLTPIMSFLFHLRMKKLGVNTRRFMFDWYASSTHIRTLWLKKLYRLNIQNGYFTGNTGVGISKIVKILQFRKNSNAIKRISKPATYIYGLALILGLGVGLGVLTFENIIEKSDAKPIGILVCFLLLFALMYLLLFLTRMLEIFNAKRILRRKKIDDICDNLNDLSWYLEMMQQEERLTSGSKSHHYMSANSSAFANKLRY